MCDLDVCEMQRSTIKCYVCDGELDCSFPVQKECPPNNECFTVAESYNPNSNEKAAQQHATPRTLLANCAEHARQTSAMQGQFISSHVSDKFTPECDVLWSSGPRDRNSANDEKTKHVFQALCISAIIALLNEFI
uniref:Protein quiver n=1 Tax=Ascaris lumbricoides TaxID=6252 RepID=A0A0M3I8U1_ASCLU